MNVLDNPGALGELSQACEHFVAGRTAADPAHDISHIRRVVTSAKELTQQAGADLRVTLPAAWLHDCVQVPKNSPDRAKASSLAANAAVKFLQSIDYPTDLLDQVHHAVEAHSYSAGIPVRSLEAGIVQDADRLDALGAIGVARTLLTGATMGSGLYQPDDPFGQQREPDDRSWMLDHFYAKLFKLADTMQTDAGRIEARRRSAVMQEFLQSLGREIGHEAPSSNSTVL